MGNHDSYSDTFNDHTASDSSSFSVILLGMRHEETGKS